MNIKKQHKQLGLTQSQYWNPLGITQSGGSRYEAGRKPPETVQMLATLKYGSQKERERVAKRLGIRLA